MTEENNLIEPEALHQQLDAPGLIILDCSWYLPGQNRVARDEYEIAHIPGARFFDIDAISDQDTDLPHMIPASSYFVNKVEELGISNTSQDRGLRRHRIVFSRPRVVDISFIWSQTDIHTQWWPACMD